MDEMFVRVVVPVLGMRRGDRVWLPRAAPFTNMLGHFLVEVSPEAA